MKPKEWLLADLGRAKKADLERYLSKAAEDGYTVITAPKNNKARIAQLRELRSTFWDDEQQKRSSALAHQHELHRAAMKFCAAARGVEPTEKITASEANAFLRSLPPHQPET